MIKDYKPEIVRKIWGGQKLQTMKSLPSQAGLEPVGETLEIFDPKLSYLAKFIDTSDELSIQVHPHDEYARMHENASGKTECWIILAATPGAGIYLGLKPHVTKENLKLALVQKKPINEYLNFYEVKAGDFFYVPAGSIHAIGRNITLAEVQQNSGITYRVWDWNRLDKLGNSRELHVDKSLDVINFDPAANTLEFFKHKKNLFDQNGLSEICSHPDFKLFQLNQKKGDVYKQKLTLSRPCSILNLGGSLIFNKVEMKSYQALTLDEVETKLEIQALEDGSLLLIF